MTIEYVLLMIAIFAIGLKTFISAPTKAFKEAGPRLGSRIEMQLMTGDGFKIGGKRTEWQEPK